MFRVAYLIFNKILIERIRGGPSEKEGAKARTKTGNGDGGKCNQSHERSDRPKSALPTLQFGSILHRGASEGNGCEEHLQLWQWR